MLQTPVTLAHFYWKNILKPGDRVLDATCGQGRDALFLAESILRDNSGFLYVMDIQSEALLQTKERLNQNLPCALWNLVDYTKGCHSDLRSIEPVSLDLVVYNLGYLPGSNKELTTTLETTLQSFNQALERLKKGGYLSIACYPGHEKGEREERGVLNWAKSLPSSFVCCHHRWINRSKKAPNLLLVQKN